MATIPNDPVAIQKFFTSRDNYANANTFVGEVQRLWYNPITNCIYVSDGNTPGGIAVGCCGSGNTVGNITVSDEGSVLTFNVDSFNFVGAGVTASNVGNAVTITIPGGIQGIQGITGTQGTTGAQGIQGVQGAIGTQGVIGTQGITGTQGTQGVQGATGSQGTTGTQGLSDRYATTSSSTLTIGNGTQTLTVGTGLSYSVAQDVIIAYDIDNHMIGMVSSYDPVTGAMVVAVTSTIGSGQYSAWTVNLNGAVGQQGAQGAQGIQGVQGVIGAQGVTGAQGIQGVQGVQGIQGVVGAQGAQGVQGIQGAQGIQGIFGTQGITGTGTQGTIGAQGVQGIIGTQGTTPGFGYYGAFHTDYDTVLDGGINSNSTAPIAVTSTTGWPTTGALLIKEEIIAYTGISGNTFTGITRGVSGSNGAVHATGSPVSFAQIAAANTETTLQIDQTDFSNGVTLNASTNEVTIPNAGVYNCQFSAQTACADNAPDDIAVWFVVNGTNVPSSASYVTTQQIHANHLGAAIITVNIFYQFTAGQKLTLKWVTLAGTSVITSYAPTNGIPASPSVILTVNQIA
jgi:hypothetical protein